MPGKSTKNKKKKSNKKIDDEDVEDIMGTEADDTIDKGYFSSCSCIFH